MFGYLVRHNVEELNLQQGDALTAGEDLERSLRYFCKDGQILIFRFSPLENRRKVIFVAVPKVSDLRTQFEHERILSQREHWLKRKAKADFCVRLTSA